MRQVHTTKRASLLGLPSHGPAGLDLVHDLHGGQQATTHAAAKILKALTVEK